MLRSAAILVALIVFPGIALAQEGPGEATEQRTHTVERGETLWALARRYYENPYFWRNIYEANEGTIRDPHWIYPGQSFVLPGMEVEAAVTDVEVAGPERAAAPGTGLRPGPGEPTVFSVPPRENTPRPEERTSFYREAGEEVLPTVVGAENTDYMAVPWDIFYAAEWLVPSGRTSFAGEVVGWAGTDMVTERLRTARPHDRLRVEWRSGSPPEPGARLQAVRIARRDRDLGIVIQPTGIVEVLARSEAGLVVESLNEYARLRVGDFVVPAEPFPLERGQHPEATRAGPGARIIAFGTPRAIQQMGDIAFLDVGRADGVRVGDEFVVEVSAGGGWSAEVAGRLQVVRVFEGVASARILDVDAPVFRAGTELRIDRRMP